MFAVDFPNLIDVVDRARAGDRSALAELFNRYHRYVAAIARGYLRNYEHAEEATQDVFVIVMRKIGTLHDSGAFVAWLRSMTVNRSLSIRRRAYREQLVSESEVLERIDKEEPWATLVGRESSGECRSWLDNLCEIDRKILVAQYLEGKSFEQIAHEFNIPRGTARRRAYTARHRLAEYLESINEEPKRAA